MNSSSAGSLIQINLDDLVASFGWENRPLLARLLRRIFIAPAVKFAHQMAEFDSAVGERGLVEGSRLALRKYFDDIRLFGADLIPDSAFLALSNHPGMSDTLSTFVALNRPDLQIIASKRPFLEALRNVSRQLFYVTEDPASRMALIRRVSMHLRSGGAVLTYPAGRIEPDPDLHDDAVDSLGSWTDSVGAFLRLAPETAILPVLVRGVVWDKAAYHPLTYIKRTREEREKLAAALQLFAHMMLNVKAVAVRVQIGKPIHAKELGTIETQVIHRAVLNEMRRLIEKPPEGEGIQLL